MNKVNNTCSKYPPFPKPARVIVLCKGKLCLTLITIDDRSAELLWLKLRFTDGFLYVVAIYIPPRSSADIMFNAVTVYTDIEKLLQDSDEVLLVGDFNQPNLSWIHDDEIENILRPINATFESEVA